MRTLVAKGFSNWPPSDVKINGSLVPDKRLVALVCLIIFRANQIATGFIGTRAAIYKTN